MSLSLPASSQNSTKMKNHSSLLYNVHTWTCFLVWGKKDTPPTLLHQGVCTIYQLTDQSVIWLIYCYLRVRVNVPDRSCTLMPSVFTSPGHYWCQNQFIIPFTHRAGEKFWIRLEFSQLADSRFAQLPHTVLPSVVLHVVITWWIKSSDRNCSVLFPAKNKTDSQIRLGKFSFLPQGFQNKVQ